jgi:Zn-dependent protease
MNNLNEILYTIAQSLPGFLLAIVAHEAAHAWMADKFGDPTAKNLGRLSLNPAVHYDPWGTIFFPLLGAVLSWGMIIGWAKPVPVETRNFKNYRTGLFWVSFAGPLANLILGTLSALLIGLLVRFGQEWDYARVFLEMLQYSVLINFVLAFFNLIPLPPLDGSKMISSFLKGPALRKYEEFARYTPVIFMGVFMLSFMGISTLGYLLQPAHRLANYMMFSFVGLIGGIG